MSEETLYKAYEYVKKTNRDITYEEFLKKYIENPRNFSIFLNLKKCH